MGAVKHYLGRVSSTRRNALRRGRQKMVLASGQDFGVNVLLRVADVGVIERLAFTPIERQGGPCVR